MDSKIIVFCIDPDPFPPPSPPPAHREQSQTFLSTGELDTNRSVGLTKDPVNWGRGVTLG